MGLGPFDERSKNKYNDRNALLDFFNRLLTLPVSTQHALFSQFMFQFDLKTREAEARGEVDGGVRSLNGRAIGLRRSRRQGESCSMLICGQGRKHMLFTLKLIMGILGPRIPSGHHLGSIHSDR